MLRIFSRVRRSLFTQNKFTRYLFYALGEIILVVIGILLALQVNNWNDRRKAVQRSEAYLIEMLKDLEQDTLEVKDYLRTIQRRVQAENWFLRKKEFAVEDMDSLGMVFSPVYFDFYVHDAIYQRIQNSGDSRLIGYENLSKKINRYYTDIRGRAQKNSEYEIREATQVWEVDKRLSTEIEITNDLYADVRLFPVNPEFEMVLSPEEQTKKYLDLVSTIEARNKIRKSYYRHTFLVYFFKVYDRESEFLLREINSELNNISLKQPVTK